MMFLFVYRWTEVIKSAVDDLKKSGAQMRLPLPPGPGGSPFSPSTYVCVCEPSHAKGNHFQISHFFASFPRARLNAPSSPTENGGVLKSGIGEIAEFLHLQT